MDELLHVTLLRRDLPADAGLNLAEPARLLDAEILINAVLPPQLNATLYGVLAKLPGVSFDKSVTDASGRTDVGFSTIQEGYLKDEIMVSPSTFAYLGLEETAVVDHTEVETDGTFHIVKGQVLGGVAELAAGIVDQAGQRP